MLLAVAAVLGAGYFLWLRDSGLVSVNEVDVVGIEGPEREAVTTALTEAAGAMTTLHMRADELERAVARFPTVAGIEVDAQLLHGLQVTVTERPPVLAVKSPGTEPVAVAGDGTILGGVAIDGLEIPSVRVASTPAGNAVDGDTLAAATVAGAVPAPLLPLTRKVSMDGADSISVELRGGIPILFGDSSRATEKWEAVAAILADPRVDRVTSIDVRVPERPALGGAAPPPEVPETDVETVPADPVTPEPAPTP
ncbi:hypothetical protein BH24ACT23_BH24ACT23_03560 [soil metagenome]